MSKRLKPGGKIFAFEPCPNNRKRMEELIMVNHLSLVIFPFEYAVADMDGEQNLILSDNPLIYLLESFADGPMKAITKKIPGRTAQVDTLVFQGRIPPPDSVKLDIEGGSLGR